MRPAGGRFRPSANAGKASPHMEHIAVRGAVWYNKPEKRRGGCAAAAAGPQGHWEARVLSKGVSA